MPRPKYHCELNYIEMVWALVKQKLRRSCTYDFADLENRLPNLLDNEIPISSVRKFARYCYRFMSGYECGLQGGLLEYAMKKYSSHRTIPAHVIETLEREYEAKNSLKQSKK